MMLDGWMVNLVNPKSLPNHGCIKVIISPPYLLSPAWAPGL